MRADDTVEWLGRNPCWLVDRSEFLVAEDVQDLNSRSEEGYRAITSTQISWSTGFGNRGYNCVFPNGGNIAVVD